jgi:hypothetical protein
MYRRDRYLLRMDAIDLASTCCPQNPFFSSGWAKTVQSRSEPRFRSDLGFHPWLFDVHDSFGLARGIAVDKAAIAMNWKRIIHREHVLVRDGELPIFSSVHMARPREHFAGLAPAKSRCERIQNTYDGNCKARDTIFGGKTSHCVVEGRGREGEPRVLTWPGYSRWRVSGAAASDHKAPIGLSFNTRLRTKRPRQFCCACWLQPYLSEHWRSVNFSHQPCKQMRVENKWRDKKKRRTKCLLGEFVTAQNFTSVLVTNTETSGAKF